MAVKKKDYLIPNPCLPDRQAQSLPTRQAGPIPKALVLLSGGLDSSTVLAIAKAEGYELYAVSFDYNQRHSRELESAKLVADALNVRKHLIVKFDLREIGGSALTSEMEVPKKVSSFKFQVSSTDKKKLAACHLQPATNIPVTYVPARNTIFLSFALGWAEVLEAENIFIGANAIDYSGYPDCRPEYLKAFEEMANLATKASVEGKMRFAIRAPLVSMTKSEIIKRGTELGLDYSLTWSCYDPQPVKAHSSKLIAESKKKNSKGKTMSYELRADLVPCRSCDSCRLREKGFKEAGLKDPLLKD